VKRALDTLSACRSYGGSLIGSFPHCAVVHALHTRSCVLAKVVKGSGSPFSLFPNLEFGYLLAKGTLEPLRDQPSMTVIALFARFPTEQNGLGTVRQRAEFIPDRLRIKSSQRGEVETLVNPPRRSAHLACRLQQSIHAVTCWFEPRQARNADASCALILANTCCLHSSSVPNHTCPGCIGGQSPAIESLYHKNGYISN
jgi:hypothetical protein